MKAKKSLGQNFFINQNLAKSIVNISLQTNPDIVVEIGPGKGYFTQLISSVHKEKIILIEKDTALATDLRLSIQNAEVKNIDFLDWNFEELSTYKGKSILFFGSLPYNVSKMIIRKIIESEYFNNDCFFIIQKEVAEKYSAKESESNLLSMETELYAKAKREFDISPASFTPRPKVTSSFIRFSPTKKIFDIDKKEFKSFLKLAFRQPRKTLRNNLKGLLFKDQEIVETLLSKRAQHLSLDEYIFLFSKVDTVLV